MTMEHHDVIIIGAGLSGIGTACHLARECPGQNYLILERRQAVGGTWDLFRYPGIRSDSDMFSFGYAFRPWNALQTLADGPAIRQYISDTAKEHGVSPHIRFGQETQDADWDSATQRWTVTTRDNQGEEQKFSCRFLISCTGYYDHKQGHLPNFPGVDSFKGRCIHPQQWPEDLDYRGKRVVVIGSGATAVTLVPAMAEDAAHITMLQRSPSYIMSVPAHDTLTSVLSHLMPKSWAYRLARRRNIAIQRWIYKAAKRWPEKTRRFLLKGVSNKLNDQSLMPHFTPRYMPWDQRLCAVPNGDLFTAINSGKASVVTDQIAAFTENGIRLASGQELEADIVITATGLQLQVLGGTKLTLDGAPCKINERMTYKGVLLEGVPNMAWIFGYTNAPWTLKADIAARYVCRLLNHLQATGLAVAQANDRGANRQSHSMMGALESGYIQRANAVLPRQGAELPWQVLNAYEVDSAMLLEEPIEDEILELEPHQRGNPTPSHGSSKAVA